VGVGSSFSFIFQHPSWPGRVLIGGFLELFPLLVVVPGMLALTHSTRHLRPSLLIAGLLAAGLALLCRWIQLGYMRRIAAEVMAGREAGLPAWDRFETDLTEGLKLWLVSIGLMLPVLGIAASLLLLFGAVGLRPLGWVLALLTLPVAGAATLFYLPAALLATVAEGTLVAAFDLSSVAARLGRVFAPYLLAVLVAFATEVLAQLGLLLACVGIFFTRFVAHCIAVHAFASAWADTRPAAEPGLSPHAVSDAGATKWA
jgi:hypothetical protein